MPCRPALGALCLAAILATPLAAHAQAADVRATVVLEDDARSAQVLLIQSIQSDLQAIAAIAMGSLGDLERSEIQSRIRASQTALARLTQSLQQVHVEAEAVGVPGARIRVAMPLAPEPVAVDEPAPPREPERDVMRAHEFQQFMRMWKGASFESERRTLLESAFGSQRSTVQQILAMLKELTFESEKLSTVEFLAPHMPVSERPRAYQLMEAMQFSSTRTQLQELLDDAFKAEAPGSP